ncbi:anti-sigma factor [Vreelandella olivaria]|uniref:anti-sigma factor n=1 Tax=Vreelandella olivaria TaxID=390919 RepID=UPI00201ED48D|nr:hypothetical protein [Halomonas olivaria]
MTRPDEYDDLHALAGEYVLGTLPLAEREAFEARLATDIRLQKAMSDWEERFFPYTAIVDPVTPSDYLWPRIERSLKARPVKAVPPASSLTKRRPLVHGVVLRGWGWQLRLPWV